MEGWERRADQREKHSLLWSENSLGLLQWRVVRGKYRGGNRQTFSMKGKILIVHIFFFVGHSLSLNWTGLLLILPEAKPIYWQWTVVRESTRLQARKTGSWCAKHQNFPHGFQARVFKDNPGGEGRLPRWLSDNLPANAEDMSLIPGLGRSLEKEMATHSSILTWEIPWTE